jgi:hypothetical protein
MSLHLTKIKIKTRGFFLSSFYSDDIGYLLRNDDFRSKWCGHIRESSIEDHVQSTCRFYLHPFFYLKRKNLITKWSSLFSLKTEGEWWWNSNSIFAFFHYYDIYSGKRENYNLSLFLPESWLRRRCVSFSFSLKCLFCVRWETILTIWWRYKFILYCIYIQTKSDE